MDQTFERAGDGGAEAVGGFGVDAHDGRRHGPQAGNVENGAIGLVLEHGLELVRLFLRAHGEPEDDAPGHETTDVRWIEDSRSMPGAEAMPVPRRRGAKDR
jgi:hypothetical protein